MPLAKHVDLFLFAFGLETMPEELLERFSLSGEETGPKSTIPKIKRKNRLSKKQHKLWKCFARKILDDSVISYEYSTENRCLLIDNRDYVLNISTEELLNFIQQILPQAKINDVFILPSKMFIMIQFSSSVICQNVEEKLNQIEESNVYNFVSISDQLFDAMITRYSSQVLEISRLFDKKPDGLQIQEEFISADEENGLIRLAEQCFEDVSLESCISKLRNRKAVHFGYVFDYQQNSITLEGESVSVVDQSVPPECVSILKRMQTTGLIPEMADQLTINHYDGSKGDHIPLHCDTHSMCTEWIVSLSVGTDTVMTFENPRTNDRCQKVLKARSVMLMKREARYLWKHGIQQTSFDLVPWNSTGLCRMETCDSRLAIVKRGVRYSFTFRKIAPSDYVCRCSYPESCNSQEVNQKVNEMEAEKLEMSYVHRTYDEIAEHFSATRYGCWPRVVEFLQSLPNGALLIDVGCGNGKYLSVDQNRIVSIGTDRSYNLLKICQQRNFETFFDDCLNVDRTLRHGLFDAAICIAVIHHLASEERRLQALLSLVNLLSVGGRALVYVWAFEQRLHGKASKYLKESNNSNVVSSNPEPLSVHRNRSEFKQQDLFVPFTKGGDSTELRFYHVFREGELKLLIEKLPPGLVKLETIYYDQGNWCSIFQRL